MEKSTFEAHATFLDGVRAFFKDRKYLEALTPHIVPTPGTEVHLRYFETKWVDHQKAVHSLYLRSSPELHLKKVLATGIERCFQIASCFRNHGELSAWHRPEFLMLEFYRAHIEPRAFIDETFEFLQVTRDAVLSRHNQGNNGLHLPETYTYLTVNECFDRFAGISLVDMDASLAQKAIKAGVQSVQKNDDFETAFFKVLLERVEPEIAKIPVAVLADYPPSQAALARVEGGVAKRFEFYVHGVELSNGFYELLSVEENRKRYAAAHQRRLAMGYESPALDKSFEGALRRGIPECCGNALGLDRWFALILGKNDLSFLDQDVFDVL